MEGAMADRRPANPLALAVLVLLTERPMHPYQMSTTLRARRKEDSIKINYGSLYSVVESLQKRGLIEVQETLRAGNRPARTVYAITAAGHDLMVGWLSDLLSTPAKDYPLFEAALSLMPALPPADVVPLLERRLETQRGTLEWSRAQLTNATGVGMPRLFAIEHEYEIAMLAAEVEFLAALLDDLRSGEFGGLSGWRRIHELRAAGVPEDDVWTVIRDENPEEFAWLDQIDDLT
jgi:DNA-binding PadR family transcriptional regulator